jgi:hypothetical protein
LEITTGSLPSITATQLLVVPKSIPITLLMLLNFVCDVSLFDDRPLSTTLPQAIMARNAVNVSVFDSEGPKS